MYLKRLELHGFKSFAPTTAFEFGPGVTCIVGPNGAGKTNVAEAIRWVLGEQASRIIRARKTEDIIFSGSATRSPMGLAEVRLTLDNSDGWLPIDFEEVVVSRRAYRSGESEYYLNQSRVRLRDLSEFFLKAEVGQNSYAFMGQGLVEQVLTLRPEERRSLIEEAADVRLHRDKLDEARHRLAATRDNLERVDMLVREIEPRLRQLERQADRAATHARLSAELAEALQALYGQQWQEAQEALAAARAACDQRQEEFERARKEVEACEEGLSALVAAVEERRRDIAQRQEALRSLQDYRRDLERRITVDDERQEMLHARRAELAGEMEALRREREELTALIAAQQERAGELAEELVVARAADEGYAELSSLDARLAELREALAETEHKAGEASAQLAEGRARSASLAQRCERLGSEVASLQDARVQQVALLKAWAREFALRRERAMQLAPAVQRTARDFGEVETRMERASGAVSRREEELRTLALQIETGEARLEAALATDVELPPADAGVEALLEHGGRLPGLEPPPDSHIHGLVGMVGQLIRVPQGLERAIEAALADALHGVVVETQEDALAAAELLVSEDLGRATVFPLTDVKSAHPLNLLEERGVIGVASEVVRCDSRYRPLVNALLGRVIVAQNLGVARALLRRGLGSVVTLDGIVLHPVGSITAGSARAVRRALAHQRETGELPGELQRQRAAHAEATAALEGERRELTEAQQGYDQLAPELDRLRADLTEADAALRQHRARLPATSARLSALHARLAETRRSVTEAEEGLAGAARTIQRAAAQVEATEAQRAALRRQVEQLVPQREAVAHGVAQRSSRVAALEAEEQALEQQRAVQQAGLDRVEDALRRREELAARVEEELATLLGRLQATRNELDEKSREAETAQEELVPARHSLEQLDSRQRTINEELAAARSSALAAERVLLDAEASVHLRSEELEALRARLAEEGFHPSPEGELVPAHGDRPPAWLTSEREGADGELPPMRGGAPLDPVALKERISELRSGLRNLGPVNEQAEVDFAESRERYEFLSGQLADLREAEDALQGAIEELEGIIKERFSTTYRQVNTAFQRYFETFFGGGHAELLLTRPDEEALPGIDIVAQPPRKRVRTLNMLSGGERSLTAVALLFALLDTHPSPICVLDEVDAALDEANVGRFTATLRDLAERTQFIIITHNRRTLEMADTIYGVSMGADSTSSVLSLRLAEVPEKLT